jgi:hypothetical protein
MNVKIEIIHEGQTFSGEIELLPLLAGEARHLKVESSGRVIPQSIKKPSAALQFLYRKNFFRDPQTLPEVWNELRKEGFNFGRPAVLMALQAADYLTMNGKRGSYRFVQKFPPTV